MGSYFERFERRNIMEITEHNERLESEVIGWKAKVDDVIGKFDNMPPEDKEKVVPLFDELHMSIEELTTRIENLNPALREHDKTKKGGKFAGFRKIWKEMWRHSVRMHYGHL